MGSRFNPDKNASQIVFDITGGEKHLSTMNLATIPNRKPHIKNENENFSLRTDDIDGARYVKPKIFEHNFNMDISDIQGTKTKPMVDESKKPVDLMNLDDIDGSRPRIIRQLPHSNRMLNPVDPQYTLPSYKQEKIEPPKFIRDTMKNDDVEGAHPMTYKTDKPAKDIMKIDDISGTRPVHRMRELKKGIDPLYVKDINNDGIFKTTRVVDPLNPVYIYDGQEIRGDDYGKVKPPPKGHNMPQSSLYTGDIQGAKADSTTKKYREYRQPPPPKEEDDLKPADILMTPSMAKQTSELEHQQQVRTMRGEKIRFYENRNLHAEKGTGDPIQGLLRQQRENRNNSRTRHPTF